mgnify:CR=1 FL=1
MTSVAIVLFSLLSSCYSQPTSSEVKNDASDSDFKVVGYLMASNFNKIDLIELDRLTHLNLAFANPGTQGNLVFSDDADIKPVIKKAHDHGLKVFISLAGGGNPDKEAWKSALDPLQRTVFINNILSFVETNNLDGVDVDIEWNLLPSIGDLYTPFVVELSAALLEKGKSITTALGASGLHEAVTQESLEAYDFINVMVYDKTGVWKPDDIGPHSPYSYAEEAIRYWTIERDIPAERIVLGIPFYGIDFATPARYISYRDLIKEDPSNAYQDSVGLKYYNGIPTVVKKTELAKMELGGVMIWEVSQDTIGPMSLLRAIDQSLKAGDCKVSIYYRDENGDGLGDPNQPFHSCSAPEGYVADH